MQFFFKLIEISCPRCYCQLGLYQLADDNKQKPSKQRPYKFTAKPRERPTAAKPELKMTHRDDIVSYCNQRLGIDKYTDYCPNGLQVEGKKIIKKIITGVSACLDLLIAAEKEDADMIIVHHGYFWKNEKKTITGIQKKRIQTLIQHNINLLGYHLPLDGHQEIGNNAMLAKVLNWTVLRSLPSSCGSNIGMLGKLSTAVAADALKDIMQKKLGHAPLMVSNNPKKEIRHIAWCSGAAADDIEFAIQAGADAFMTGEPIERIYHIAKEENIVFYACGHHATERYGVQALGEEVAEKFNIEHQFIDIHCPI